MDTNVPIRENYEFLNHSLTNHPMMGIEPTIGCIVLPGAIISATGKRKLTLEGDSVVEPLAEVMPTVLALFYPLYLEYRV